MTFQLMLFPDFKEKAFTLSYDDGNVCDVRLIEIMQKNGLKGTFNLNSGFMQYDSKVKDVSLYLDSGNEVAVHGKEHLSLTACTDEQIEREILLDRVKLEEMTGKLVTGMAYANGVTDDRVVDILKKCGIDYSRTTKSTKEFKIDDDWLRLKPTCHHDDEQIFELADKFLSNEEYWYFWGRHPKLFYVWGHSYEFDKKNNWERFEEFASKIGNKEDVWYATNGEIYRYVEAFKSLRYGVGNSCVYNPSSLDVFIIRPNGKKYKVPAGQTITLEE